MVDDFTEERVRRFYQDVPNVIVVTCEMFTPGIFGVKLVSQGKPYYEICYDRRWNVPVGMMAKYHSPDRESGIGFVSHNSMKGRVECFEDLKVLASDLFVKNDS